MIKNQLGKAEYLSPSLKVFMTDLHTPLCQSSMTDALLEDIFEKNFGEL